MERKRRLIWVPVIHTEADFGSLYRPIKRLYVGRVGQKGWARHREAVDQLWAAIRRDVGALRLDYTRVRLYQDGLPLCGREEEIVRAVAQSGSANHQLLLDLARKGATLVGTESPELLLKEYETVQRHLTSLEGTAGKPGDAPRPGRFAEGLRQVSREMLERRDAYIAERISHTLQGGETGLVFLGLLHSLHGRLPDDIQVSLLGPASGLVRKGPHHAGTDAGA